MLCMKCPGDAYLSPSGATKIHVQNSNFFTYEKSKAQETRPTHPNARTFTHSCFPHLYMLN